MNGIFRTIVVVATGAFILEWTLPFYDYLWFDQEELDLLSWAGHKAIISPPLLVYWLMFAAWLVLSVGLFFYIRLARSLFVIYMVISFILIPLFGYNILSPLYIFLYATGNLLDGAIIAIAYLTSVNEKFDQKPGLGLES